MLHFVDEMFLKNLFSMFIFYLPTDYLWFQPVYYLSSRSLSFALVASQLTMKMDVMNM